MLLTTFMLRGSIFYIAPPLHSACLELIMVESKGQFHQDSLKSFTFQRIFFRVNDYFFSNWQMEETSTKKTGKRNWLKKTQLVQK
jgi:hypothetical protein